MSSFFPSLRWPWPKAQPSGAAERYADHDLVYRRVTMPAERRAGLVLRNQHVDEVLRPHPDPRGKLLAQRLQRRRQLANRSFVQCALVVVEA